MLGLRCTTEGGARKKKKREGGRRKRGKKRKICSPACGRQKGSWAALGAAPAKGYSFFCYLPSLPCAQLREAGVTQAVHAEEWKRY